MGLFRIISKARSYSVLPFRNGSLVAEFEQNGIKHKSIVTNISAQSLLGHTFSNELHIESQVQADDIFEALAKSQSFGMLLLDRLAFLIGAPVYDIEPIKCYDITPGIEEREYVQFYKNALDKIGSKTASTEQMSIVFGALSKVKEDRILRSLYWFRKSLGVYDPLDRFTYIWVGLETLNPLFQKMYSDEVEITKCSKCGFERAFIGTAPLKKFFRDHLNNEKLYSQARDIRQGLLHGYMDFGVIIERVQEILPDIAGSLREAIALLIGLPQGAIKHDINLSQAEPIVVVFVTKLVDLIIDENNPNYIEPDFNLEVDIYEKNGNLVFHPIVSTKIMDTGVAISSLNWDLIGESGYPFKKTAITFKG